MTKDQSTLETFWKDAALKAYEKITIETVSGISIVNATAAVFSQTIVEGKEKFVVMPLPENLKDIKKYALFSRYN